MKRIESVNAFVVKFANVNGSGSASANELFAKAILRMGVPVSPRNIFPSNIQGLPTWYEVRVSESGWVGRRGGVDLMVAMNPQTWDKDIAMIEPGGYLFYDSTKPMPAAKFREDINVIGVPLTAICNREYTDPRQRQLFKNIMYVGALTALLEMDVAAVEQLISEQFKGKEKLFDANKNALHLGRDWALMNLECPIGLRLKRTDKVGDRIFIEGNSAAAPECSASGSRRRRTRWCVGSCLAFRSAQVNTRHRAAIGRRMNRSTQCQSKFSHRPSPPPARGRFSSKRTGRLRPCKSASAGLKRPRWKSRPMKALHGLRCCRRFR